MRFMLAAIAMVVFGIAGQAQADTTQPADVAANLNENVSESTSDAVQPPQNWNRWFCRARSRTSFRSFWGTSWYFRAGSGEGQAAKEDAKRRAIRNCEFRTRGRCFSSDRSCQVQRYN